MQITDLPEDYTDWLSARTLHLEKNLTYSKFTADLYQQYKKHLGPFRYLLLKQAQVLVAPQKVKTLLSLGNVRFLLPAVQIYKLTRLMKLERILKNVILPKNYKKQIEDLDVEDTQLSKS